MTIMSTLRIIQTSEGDGYYRIELEFVGDHPRLTATARFSFEMTEQECQDIRWYIESYPENPFDPHPARAARVEQLMQELGVRLFRHLFSQKGQYILWSKIYEHLSKTRIEIISSPQEAEALPWELLRDPDTDTILALHAGAFVRTHPESIYKRQIRSVHADPPIRILLVISRPGGQNDVPFRAVSSRLIKGLSEESRAVFRLDVLRPPTFARLGEVLRTAHQRGEPYHVVHFDGHGVYANFEDLKKMMMIRSEKFHMNSSQGFLLFETDEPDNPRELIHGFELGDLLFETGVSCLVLNSERSAHFEVPDRLENIDSDDPYAKLRAFGSLAQQVMLQGVTGVVAMRYSVYVVTVAQFVADLYASLTRGFTLGEAVTFGRKQLAANPQRHIVQTIDLQDWMVPVVYEAEPVQLFAPSAAASGLNITIKPADATPARGTLDEDLPPEPDVGFFGRDETLLALDRGFDRHHVIVLHAYAGSGKTTAAAEFARWYSLTGGVEGPVLFTSFEQHKPLVQVLDQLGRMFDPVLRQSGLEWDAIPDAAQKRDIALQILQQVSVLWLWDNVEPVAGFPAGTPSAWTEAEQRELLAFLRDARQTQAKFLLTSQRDERGWLGDLPARVEMLPMPLNERWQLAEALAAKYGVAFDQSVWRSLLVYSGGNPLTLTVVVGQALRDGLRTAHQIEAYVQRLRAGEAAFDDDASQGRTKSLGASLSYGFVVAFTEEERLTLALLHHFQGFVEVDTLTLMGNSQLPGHLPELSGLTREQGIALLDRAAEVGLLAAHGAGYYAIHPALPWFFHQLYQQYYPDDAPARAYVEALGELGRYYADQYGEGNRGVIAALNAEEANLLHAWRLAQQHGWYSAIISTMQGLRQLYDHTGRRAEWRRLVEEIVPLFVDPASDGPLSGREAQWALTMGYRVQLLHEERQWGEAARLQELAIDYDRQLAAPLLARSAEQLDNSEHSVLRSLAVSVEQLGKLQSKQGAAACMDSYLESYELALRIDDQAVAASCAFTIGRVYLGNEVPALRNLAMAEQWYQRSLELTPEVDLLGRGKILGQLGLLTIQHFTDLREDGQSETVLREQLNLALTYTQQALSLSPTDAIDSLAVCHDQLGIIYSYSGQTEHAIAHYREAIRYFEQMGNLYSAADTRENVAIAYAQAGRFDDALLFARAALSNFEQFGPAAADRVERALKLIENIEYTIGQQPSEDYRKLNEEALKNQNRGDSHKARELFERALVICERYQGLNHPETARILTHLAILLQQEGDMQLAQEQLERAFAINSYVLGEEHQNTILTRSYLGILRWEIREIESAQSFFDDTMYTLEHKLIGVNSDENITEDVDRPVLDQMHVFLQEIHLAQTTKSPRRRLASLNRALGLLAEIPPRLANLPQDVQQLISNIIVHWRDTITREAARSGKIEIRERVHSPYIFTPPVQGTALIGRDDIFARIESLWSNKGQRNSLIIHGHRRMGKTSIAQALTSRCMLDNGTHLIYLSLEGQKINREGDLYYCLVERIWSLFEGKIRKPGLKKFKSDDSRFYFDSFLLQLSKKMEIQSVLIILDEFEMLYRYLGYAVANEVIDYLRAQTVTHSWLALALVGLSDLYDLSLSYSSSLLGWKSIRVSFLEREQVENILVNPPKDLDFPLDYTSAALQMISTCTNGQPYLVQVIGDYLVQRYNHITFTERRDHSGVFDVPDIETILEDPDFYTTATAYFNGVWGQAKRGFPGEVVLLKALAMHEDGIDEDSLRTVSELDEQSFNEAFNALRRHDILWCKDRDGNACNELANSLKYPNILCCKNENNHICFAVPLMHRWVNKTQI